ncbi:hypothetical protein D3C78_1491220 [compost metagenome]
MVGVVVIHLGFQLVEHLANIGFFYPHAQTFALELRTIHAAPGIARFTITPAHGHFQQGIGVRSPTQCQIAIPFVPARGHAIAIAVLIIMRA